jgi:hypothetical protein
VPYFVNKMTGTSSWERPVDAARSLSGRLFSPVAPPSDAGDGEGPLTSEEMDVLEKPKPLAPGWTVG